MGVIKPPWISEKWFASCVFNYCDHFGDKRVLVRLCKICADEVDRITHYCKKGEDPYDMNNVLHDIAKTFAQTMLMVRKRALKMGIDINDNSDIEENHINVEDYPIYHLVREYGDMVGEILNGLWPILEKHHSEFLDMFVDVMDHSRHFVVAKTARALSSKYEREYDSGIAEELADSKTSAFFAYVAIKRNAMGALALAKRSEKHDDRQFFLEFAEISQQLLRNIQREFFPDDELIYEEFGCDEYDRTFSNKQVKQLHKH